MGSERLTPIPVQRTDLAGHVLRRVRACSEATSALLDTLCHLASERGTSLYVVGGVIRDTLLAEPPPDQLDLDLAVDGNPIPFHESMAMAARGSLTTHERFGTAKATLPDGTSIDVARTRAERYPASGALPIVTPAPIGIDLSRRDFTINAVALAIAGPGAGNVLDPYRGISDIEHRRVRTLHADSFRDDPTRLIRAARYASRISGSLERQTLANARRDRAHLAMLTAHRFGDAWRLLLGERDSAKGLRIARRLKLTQSRDQRWTIPLAVLPAAQSAEHFWAATGLLSAPDDIAAWLAQSVGMNRGERAALSEGATLGRDRRSVGNMQRPSRVAERLGGIPNAVVEAAADVWDGASGRAVGRYLERRVVVQSPIAARRLIQLGIEPGPELGRWLKRLEADVWDGELDPQNKSSVARAEQRIRLSR